MPRILTLPPVAQSASHDCAEAAVRCVLLYHGVARPIRLRLAVPTEGADPAQLAAALWHHGMRVTSGVLTLDDLGYYCDTNRPVICLTRHHESREGHYVVVAGLRRRRVHCLDPLIGKVISVPVDDWLPDWVDCGRYGTVFRHFGIIATP